jgi:cytochrome c-type biogenesis protein CcmH
MQRRLIVMILGTMLSFSALAVEELAFDSPVKAQTFQDLIKEFRCVTCPNQSIADSQAPIAAAMRDDIYRRVQTGETSEEIREYLFSRYGEYVSYRPRLKAATWFLWSGPFILLGLGLLGFRSRVKAC